ncbi:MAG TPA: FixH family protein [Rhodospirillaceae bacterium]|nr:FixH family protein [Rhodospirillaceae bacterium]
MRSAVSALALCLSASVAGAAPADYRFEAPEPHVKAGPEAVVTVKLLHLPDKQPVKDAVIFAPRMEMPMDGMAPMATSLTPVKSDIPGEYRFKADLSMAGGWTLKLSAKVQGEAGTVSGAVPFMAMP